MHRDIKPKNLFFDENLKVKIGDFNTSVTLTESAAQKFSGSKVENEFRSMMSNNISVGTEGYQAPEMNSYNYDEKVDVYSMGRWTSYYYRKRIENGMDPKKYCFWK